MRLCRLLLTLAIGALVAAAGLLTSGSAAAAAGYPVAVCAHLGVSTTTPHAGQKFTVTGSGFAAGDKLTLELRPGNNVLGHVTADANGEFRTSATIPAGVTGSHLLYATGGTSSCPVDPAALEVQASAGVAGVSTSRGGGGALASTGAKVLTALLVATGLIGAGVLFTRSGRRRGSKQHAS